MLVFQFFAITFIKVWVFHYKHMGTMCKRSNYTQNSPQYEGDCEYRITSINSRQAKNTSLIVTTQTIMRHRHNHMDLKINEELSLAPGH